MRGRNRCRTNKLSEKNYHTTAPGVAFWYRITANFPSFLRKLIMSQQHTTQASGQGMLERVFKLREHGTTARTEVIAGFTTFLTMVYIVFVNPQILGVAGMDTSAVFVTTCLIAAFGSILMGLFANLPVALAPAMGLNAFFAFVVVQAMGLPWQVGMGAIFWGAVGLLLLTIFRVRYWMIANIPVSLRVGITSGIGLFIGMMGLKNAGVIVANPETLVSIGNLTSHSVLLGVLGFFIIAILASRNIHAAVLVSIIVTTLLGWIMGDVHYNGIVSAPPSVTSVVGHVDLAGSFNLGLAGVIFSFMLVNLFDSSGTLIGVTDKAGLADEKGKFPRMKQALFVDSISSVTGAFVGTSSVTAYIESSSGVSVGGRTGLTAVVVGILFLLVIFLSPLAGMVPPYAAAGALIYVGVLMTSSLARVNWQDLTESVPAFITAVMMPFSFSITEGIALGFISYCVMKIGTGRLRDLSPCVVIVALLFVLKIVFIDGH
ncbi:NCS2 family permease [Salmonella enterica subsp. enterica serovar Tennessee]|uniref:NCS2 family permease n=2 Tax=Salmonella enterica subsp. enterica serovar Tennessee TaxID=143221 RepID=A0A5V6DKG2_SALET|nr:NCS2 family permease [Salmonella enterica subsp. enterica serovar Tennessee]EAM6753769.1 NCS2 family permease [Salmonella enterica]EBU9956351.1 NCS2 family permease [Salmonella enterica subsp. enterica serovar Tamberma]EBW4358856.1 NCS2 family permease [Salmonella enterica subsp. enterica serovar Kintambo]EBZ8467480.1 NCS2 family permease [Salmonella enterica subsp. enterica serovar Mishmarhaemek]ECB7307383.1 NCS2 family permease [Salmonella enterica subsp. enterica serovar Yovokome]ECJ479